MEEREPDLEIRVMATFMEKAKEILKKFPFTIMKESKGRLRYFANNTLKDMGEIISFQIKINNVNTFKEKEAIREKLAMTLWDAGVLQGESAAICRYF